MGKLRKLKVIWLVCGLLVRLDVIHENKSGKVIKPTRRAQLPPCPPRRHQEELQHLSHH
jgi:hypothetical protein